MAFVWGPTDALWAATLGEVCGEAGHGPATEAWFLRRWVAHLGGTGALLCIERADGSVVRFQQGAPIEHGPSEAAGPDPVVVEEHAGGTLLRVHAVHAGRSVRLITAGVSSQARLVEALFPCVEPALQRLAVDPERPVGARGAWERAAVAMVLLQDAGQVVAANPAARRQLELGDDLVLPSWLAARLAAGIEAAGEGARSPDTWTRGHDGAGFRLSLVRVDPADRLPGTWLACVVQGGPAPRQRTDLARERFGLTARETEVVELLAEGPSNRQIAGAFDVAEATIKAHLVNVMRKASAPSRTDLLARLYTLHLVDPDVQIPATALRVRTGHLWQDDDGLVHCAQDAGTEIGLEDIRAFVRAVASFCPPGAKVFVYSDATGVRSSSLESTREAAKPMPFVGALAVRGGSAVSRALTNLWLRVFRPPYPTRLFSDRTEALEWLRSVRDG